MQIWLSGLPYDIKILVMGKLDSSSEKAITDYADLIHEQMQNRKSRTINSVEIVEISEPQVQVNAVTRYQSNSSNNSSNFNRNNHNKSARASVTYTE